MKLKCETHGRRVLSVPGSPSFHHRTGDLSKCDGNKAVMVDNTSHITRTYAIEHNVHSPNYGQMVSVGCNKEPRAHTTRNKE